MSYHSSNQLAVLVIDDDKLVHEMFDTVARHWKFSLRAVMSAEEAMNCLETYHPDVIVIDLFLHKRNGFQTLAMLQEYEYSAKCRFVAMTAYFSSAVEVRAIVEGFDDYLEKPLIVESLADRLRKVRKTR